MEDRMLSRLKSKLTVLDQDDTDTVEVVVVVVVVVEEVSVGP
jgi:hypothetical protein